MTIGKLIRLTIQVDVAPENANLREAFEYLKSLNGAEKVELIDIAVVPDPKIEERRQRRSLDKNFGSGPEKEGIPSTAPLPAVPVTANPREGGEEQASRRAEDPRKLLDRIKIR